ncbi:MAG: HoxN/HupN/NixA family nickel/cobalt transporter [Nevskia sp.]
MIPGEAGAPGRLSASLAYVAAPPAAARDLRFTRDEWQRLAGFYGFVVLLHVAGWGLFLAYSRHYPALVGLGLVAYMFGLRHAFDADHIAAVDDTVRYLLQKGQTPLGVGFFFSLGHSTVVLLLALVIIVAAAAVKRDLPELRELGGLIGACVSGGFLWLIGILNLLLLLDLLKVWRKARSGSHSHAHLDQLLAQRGLISRLFGGRLQKVISHSWQMYPLGLLFGLGFDTASEIGLIGMTAGASAGDIPVGATLSLPILFAAGMSVMDTTDGVLMVKAYNWAFVNPLRKIFYNLTTTALSIAIALLIGTIELLQVLISTLGLKGPVFDMIGRLDLGALGYVIVGLFAVGWGISVAIWKVGQIEQRYGKLYPLHTHPHEHGEGAPHSHKHFH